MKCFYPSGRGLFQDNPVPTHRTQLLTDCFNDEKKDVNHILWPPRSPDLNTMERLEEISEWRIRPPTDDRRFLLRSLQKREAVEVACHKDTFENITASPFCMVLNPESWPQTTGFGRALEERTSRMSSCEQVNVVLSLLLLWCCCWGEKTENKKN